MTVRRNGCSMTMVAILTLAVAIAASAQSQQFAQPNQTPQAPAATFTSRADLVLVPAVISGKGGQHVSGLKPEDFIVREDGKPVKLAVFEEIIASPKYTRQQPPNLPPGTFTNQQQNRTPKPLIVVALDNINTQFIDAAFARQQLINYLEKSLDDDKMVALVAMTSSGVHIIHDFATDPAVLIAALRRVRGGPAQAPDAVESFVAQDEQAALLREVAELSDLGGLSGTNAIRGEMRISALATLECLKQIGHAYGGVPGRKALVWVTGGFPFALTDSAEILEQSRNMTGEGLAIMSADYERMWEVLNNANFTLYPVDARGLVNPGFIGASVNLGSGSGVLSQRAYERLQTQLNTNADTLATFRAFAEMTGGIAFVNNNDLTRGFRAAVEDSSAYYLLGYYSTQRKPGWHKLKVEVQQEHANVRARSGYLVAKQVAAPTDAELRTMDIRLALYSPMQFSALPLQLRLVPPRPGEKASRGKKLLVFELEVPADAVEKHGSEQAISMTFVGVARDEEGKDLANFSNEVKANFPPGNNMLSFRQKFDLSPGQHTLRLVVRDNFSGRIGSVIAPVKVE